MRWDAAVPSETGQPDPASPIILEVLTLSLLRRVRRGHGVDAQLLADMGKSFRIGKAAIGDHRTQFDKPRLGKEKSWQALTGVEPHQPPG
jgi:hypothetical protein